MFVKIYNKLSDFDQSMTKCIWHADIVEINITYQIQYSV